jgi:hypothetical protein
MTKRTCVAVTGKGAVVKDPKRVDGAVVRTHGKRRSVSINRSLPAPRNAVCDAPTLTAKLLERAGYPIA